MNFALIMFLLLVATGAIALEAVQRLTAPEPVATGTVMVVALKRGRAPKSSAAEIF